MKKIFFGLLALVAMVATSCQQETDLAVNGGEATVSFNVDVPQMSRAFSDGTTATVLQYAVYDELGNLLPDLTVNDAEINLNTTIKLQLVTGNSYTVIFWAAAENAPYSIDFAQKTMTVNYTGAKSNDEARDAFYGRHNFTVKGAQTETVYLKRPFAQLNIGTNDYTTSTSAGYTPTKSYVKVSNIYSTLNLWDDTVDNGAEVVFDYNTIPSGETFPVTGYEYLAMNYLLMAKDEQTIDVEFGYTESDAAAAKTRTVGSVPVRRNYRTNIYGQLLTSDVDINVEIKPEYENNAYEAWDGTTLNEPTFDAATKTYHISHAAELAYIAQLVNGTLDTDNVRAAVAANDLKGCTVMLDCDINLNGKEWTPIGVGSNHFRGTFDGNNQTIYGLKITQRGDTRAALFGTVSHTIEFRNVTISGASIECPDFADDFYGAALIGTMYGNVTIKNVKVVDSYISGNNKVGALVAHDGVCSSLNIENCEVSGTKFEALNTEDGGSVGGLVGFFQGVAKGTQAAPYGDHHIKNSHVHDCVFNVVNSSNSGKRANAQLVGGINSKAGQILYIDDCSVANNTWNEKFYKDNVEVTSGTHALAYTTKDGAVLVGGDRNDAPKGKVIIDGKEIVLLIPIEGCEGVGLNGEGEYVVTAEAGIASIAALVAADENNFAGKTIVLDTDVDLATVKDMGDSNAPIGSTGNRDDRGRLVCDPFKGTFDGNGKTIKNFYQSGWDMGYEWGQYGSIGLFSELEGATVKNLVIESLEAQVEGGDIAFIAGSATGDCVFENITIKNSRIGTYNNGCGAIIGWSGAGTYTFKNIFIGEDVVLGGLWGSFDSSIGGLVGQAEPGATYNFENVTINCRIDAYNDCTASYDYYNYRMCGMIIGRCEETTTIDGRNYPDLSKYNFSFKNVTVNYGTWMNYHYCEPTPGLNGGRGMRIEPGFTYGGLPEDFDHTQCVDNHYNCIPFDQLIGGAQIGVKGLKAVDGVTVNYPAEYTCPLCGQQHNVQ